MLLCSRAQVLQQGQCPECIAPDFGAFPRGADSIPEIETWGKSVEGARVAVLTPAYGSNVHVAFAASMIKLQMLAAQKGFQVTPIFAL